MPTFDPGSGTNWLKFTHLDAAEIDQAVDVATAAFPAWAKSSVEVRNKILTSGRRRGERKPIIAQIEALDAGKIEAQAQGDVQNFVDTLRLLRQACW